MNRYLVTRQNINCGQTRTIAVETPERAKHAFDLAVADGVQFAEIFDMVLDAQVQMYLAPATHLTY